MPRKTARPAPTSGFAGPRGFLFSIALRDVRPPVWRRIRVGDVTLEGLHAAIQAAMGWHDKHRHCFQVGETWYGRPGTLDDQPFAAGLGDSAGVTLSSLLAGDAMPRFTYLYDMGDRWEHEVTFEGFAEVAGPTAACLAGARACPPEDCGGVGGYEYLLEILGDPDHSEHLDVVESLGNFDPDVFDPEWATARMTRMLKAS